MSDAEILRKKDIEKNAKGLFAKSFIESFPMIPVVDEKVLNDLDLRENFIEQIFSTLRH